MPNIIINIELHHAGADVGDFGHSRFLFPQMIAVACAYIDKATQDFFRLAYQVQVFPRTTMQLQISRLITGKQTR